MKKSNNNDKKIIIKLPLVRKTFYILCVNSKNEM